jgi:hypothetical protein
MRAAGRRGGPPPSRGSRIAPEKFAGPSYDGQRCTDSGLFVNIHSGPGETSVPSKVVTQSHAICRKRPSSTSYLIATGYRS